MYLKIINDRHTKTLSLQGKLGEKALLDFTNNVQSYGYIPLYVDLDRIINFVSSFIKENPSLQNTLLNLEINLKEVLSSIEKTVDFAVIKKIGFSKSRYSLLDLGMEGRKFHFKDNTVALLNTLILLDLCNQDLHKFINSYAETSDKVMLEAISVSTTFIHLFLMDIKSFFNFNIDLSVDNLKEIAPKLLEANTLLSNPLIKNILVLSLEAIESLRDISAEFNDQEMGNHATGILRFLKPESYRKYLESLPNISLTHKPKLRRIK